MGAAVVAWVRELYPKRPQSRAGWPGFSFVELASVDFFEPAAQNVKFSRRAHRVRVFQRRVECVSTQLTRPFPFCVLRVHRPVQARNLHHHSQVFQFKLKDRQSASCHLDASSRVERRFG